MTISGFVAYVKQVWKNKPDTSSPLSAERLNNIERGIKGNSDAIEAIAAAVVNQIINDPNKIASMAALYSVNSQVATNTNNIAANASGISTLNGNFQKTANLKTAKFGYDGINSFWIDYIITSTSICRIIFNASNIIQAFSSDGGATWTTIWTK